MPEGISILTMILLVVCLILSAFFSSSEAALLAADRVRVRHMMSTGVRGAQRLAPMVERPEQLLPTILLGNNLVNTAAAAMGTSVAIAFLSHGQAVLASTIVVTVVLLVFGETVPKTIAARNPERLALLYAGTLRWMERGFLPLAVILQWVSRGVVSCIGGAWERRFLGTEEAVKVMVSVGQQDGTVERSEAEMIHNVFRFGDRQVREVMTPRTEIVWVENGTSLSAFLSLYKCHYHTRFPVFEEQMDNVIGVLSVKDVLRNIGCEDLSSTDTVTGNLPPAYFVPETKLVAELFAELRQSGNQLAMVADEFGGVAGLVTIKRLIEEIVGKVGEEGESVDEQYLAIDNSTFLVDAGMSVDDVNEELELTIPEGDYETVAGFLLELIGRIPEEGDQVCHSGIRLIVTKMRGVKIETVTVTKLPPNGLVV